MDVTYVASRELLPNGGAFTSLEEARLDVAYYLDIYFNLDRRYSALGYRSPHQFKRDIRISLSQIRPSYSSGGLKLL